jgi:hypothetical protein
MANEKQTIDLLTLPLPQLQNLRGQMEEVGSFWRKRAKGTCSQRNLSGHFPRVIGTVATYGVFWRVEISPTKVSVERGVSGKSGSRGRGCVTDSNPERSFSNLTGPVVPRQTRIDTPDWISLRAW